MPSMSSMPANARDAGARIGDKIDHFQEQSYHELGYRVGAKVDQTVSSINESLSIAGITPEDVFKGVYGATSDLIVHTYDYAWSWVPFTKRKVRQMEQSAYDAKEYAKHTSYVDAKKDATEKRQELKDKAMNTQLPVNADITLGTLIGETRGIIGQVLDITAHYIHVAEKEAEYAVRNPKDASRDAERAIRPSKYDQSLIGSMRNFTAFCLQQTRHIVTYGQEKAQDGRYAARGMAREARRTMNGMIEEGKQGEQRYRNQQQQQQYNQKQSQQGYDQAGNRSYAEAASTYPSYKSADEIAIEASNKHDPTSGNRDYSYKTVDEHAIDAINKHDPNVSVSVGI